MSSSTSSNNSSALTIAVTAGASFATGAALAWIATQRRQKTEEKTEEEHNLYQLPTRWKFDEPSGGKWSSLNSPNAGERFQQDPLPKGDHPIQLYSMGTPNGQKVTILLEEFVEMDKSFEYDAWLINFMSSAPDFPHFGSEFVKINPNSKIPALLDYSDCGDDSLFANPSTNINSMDDSTTALEETKPTRVFESGSILIYLCEKFDVMGRFLPTKEQSLSDRTECINWLMFQMAAGGYLGGGFGHFYAYAPSKIKYAIDRFTMEVKRQLHVLNHQLKDRRYLTGETYTIADIAAFPWYGQIVRGKLYDGAADFLNVSEYPNVIRWAEDVWDRPAVKRGCMVNKTWGEAELQLPERHSRSDFPTVSI